MTTTHPPVTTTDPAAPAAAATPAAAEPKTSRKKAAPAGQLAVIFTPEQNESCLQSCRGGAVAWAFGPVTNPTNLRINPGLNAPIDRDLWERAKERPDTQVLMGRGLIQEIELADGSTTADGELSIDAVTVAVAIRLIYGCRDTELLERWLRKDDRQQIRERIAARIQEINDGRP